MAARYCLAHGTITLHLRTEAESRTLPAVWHDERTGEEALLHAGLRVRRVARWDLEGWQVWWELLARLAAGRPVVAALPALEGAGEVPSAPAAAYLVPPSVAVRAASPLPQGTALYLGAFACEWAPFGAAGMDDPQAGPPGIEPLYRAVVARCFQEERRTLLPVEVPALLEEGRPLQVAGLLERVGPLVNGGPVTLGGEDGAVVRAVAEALRQGGGEVAVVDPLAGLERLVWATGGLL